jgi:hypothetical protein
MITFSRYDGAGSRSLVTVMAVSQNPRGEMMSLNQTLFFDSQNPTSVFVILQIRKKFGCPSITLSKFWNSPMENHNSSLNSPRAKPKQMVKDAFVYMYVTHTHTHIYIYIVSSSYSWYLSMLHHLITSR